MEGHNGGDGPNGWNELASAKVRLQGRSARVWGLANSPLHVPPAFVRPHLPREFGPFFPTQGSAAPANEEDLYVRLKKAQRHLEMLGIQVRADAQKGVRVGFGGGNVATDTAPCLATAPSANGAPLATAGGHSR